MFTFAKLLWRNLAMKALHTVFVEPNLVGPLQLLEELAYNMRWSWDAAVRELFRRIDSDLWESTRHNPVRMLGEVSRERLEALAEDESFLYQLERVRESHTDYVKGDNTWYGKAHPETEGALVGYFSAEFGIGDSVPIFSGGLGVLAGDHLKSASDMGVPIVGVGLAYQGGYFRQYLNAEGWQQETYPVNDFYTMPVAQVKDAQGHRLVIGVPYPGREVKAYVWKVQVGRIALYLLDTNHPENSVTDRQITGQLYGGDQETRIQQEILLGMGGVRMLAALGISPPILHTNEGHAAFLVLERIRQLMQEHQVSFHIAREAAQAGVVFTTHTPVPAGIDVFPAELMTIYFQDYCRDVGLDMEEFLAIGRMPESERGSGFNMAVMAVRMSYGTNGVSLLHRETSKRMWHSLWPTIPLKEVPIGHVTNGIHIPSWISAEMGSLFDRYLGPRWREEPRDRHVWKRIEQIPMEELWRTHERRRERLVAFARQRTRERLQRLGVGGRKLESSIEVLDPEALTIGFARRFAPYKRANLLFQDIERLTRLLTHKDRPVQILFAGKAHPRDHLGKELIRNIYLASRKADLATRIVFLEDYDLNTARYLVQGVDIWLNNPRRPKEASGTSGMKAVANGALHLSTRDGWWAEVDAENIGWNIGGGEEYGPDLQEYGDQVEARALFDVLESEIVPLFYQRTAAGLPRGWVQRMKQSLMELCPVFNSNRMVREYTERYYHPALEHCRKLNVETLETARQLADWRRTVVANWGQVSVASVETDGNGTARLGEAIGIKAWVRIAPLLPQDLRVEALYGRIGANFEIVDPEATVLQFQGSETDGSCRFEGEVPCVESGKIGFTIRVLPRHIHLSNPYQTALVKLADS
jgi:starch phosphorylase